MYTQYTLISISQWTLNKTMPRWQSPQQYCCQYWYNHSIRKCTSCKLQHTWCGSGFQIGGPYKVLKRGKNDISPWISTTLWQSKMAMEHLPCIDNVPIIYIYILYPILRGFSSLPCLIARGPARGYWKLQISNWNPVARENNLWPFLTMALPKWNWMPYSV